MMDKVELNRLSVDEKINFLIKNMVMKSDLTVLKDGISTQIQALSSTLNEAIDNVQAQVAVLKEDRDADRNAATNTKNDVEVLKSEMKVMQEYVVKAKRNERNQGVHNRRYNLVFGNLIDERSWESGSTSITKVRNFLKHLQDCEIASSESELADDWNPDAIVIKEAHRLPQNPADLKPIEAGKSANRLMVAKFECMTDIGIILSKCKYLKTINERRPKHTRYFVERHYPKEVQQQKKNLKDEFERLRAEGKKPGYKYNVETASMCVVIKKQSE